MKGIEGNGGKLTRRQFGIFGAGALAAGSTGYQAGKHNHAEKPFAPLSRTAPENEIVTSSDGTASIENSSPTVDYIAFPDPKEEGAPRIAFADETTQTMVESLIQELPHREFQSFSFSEKGRLIIELGDYMQIQKMPDPGYVRVTRTTDTTPTNGILEIQESTSDTGKLIFFYYSGEGAAASPLATFTVSVDDEGYMHAERSSESPATPNDSSIEL